MENVKKHTSFRLTEDCLKEIKEIRDSYSEKLGIKISQADIIVMLVRKEHDRIFEK